MSFATQIMLDSSNLNQLSELLLDLCYEALGEHGRDDPLPDSAITPRNVANAVLGVFIRDDKIERDKDSTDEAIDRVKRVLHVLAESYCA